ncbi:ABC transporter ATP-binding protein [Nocardioides zeae]|uniref:ABC transporter ATP-binding protein n=1 Tax=Nocardioides imazamoxiresistens TaxID=3231893 RepID=A0ABU3PVZ2_9ACTN|nr:ABC transporter ATP-binding protein [Nocardioides zeae]MDT9593403.1 ABC transporter ATP-binding protein [Nocardioides zeae]
MRRWLASLLPDPDDAPPPIDDGPPADGRAVLRRTLRRHRRRLVASFALISTWQVCEALVPVAIGLIIDRAVATGDVTALVLSALGLMLLFATLSYSYRFGSRIAWVAMHTENHRIRTDVADHVLAPAGARTGVLPGEVLSIATADADVATTVVRHVAQACAGVCGLAVAVGLLVWIDPVLGLLVAVGTPLVLLVSRALAPGLTRRTAEAQGRIARASGLATDLVAGLRPLQGVGGQAAALRRYRTASADAARAGVATARSEGLLVGTTSGAAMLFLAVVTLVAGLRAAGGHLTIGELVMVVGLAQFLAEPLMMCAALVAAWAASSASAQRVADFLGTPRLECSGDHDAPADTALALDEVHHGPLRDLTLAVAPGELVGVVVDDPAVSRALLELLRAECEPEAGRVTLGGVPLHELTLDARHSHVLVAPHRVEVFEGSLAENIDPAAALAAARRDAVLAASAADDVVAISEAGLDTRVAAHGTSMSGGQQQRVALARALAADPPVLVLDEPTTAVDAVTEQRIGAGLASLRRDRSTLLLTTSPALLAAADRVLHLRGGRVVASGTHGELLAGTAYRETVLR